MNVFIGVIVMGVVFAAALVAAAGVYDLLWAATHLDELTSVDPTFPNWIGIMFVLAGTGLLLRGSENE